jgi:hypothetical protein
LQGTVRHYLLNLSIESSRPNQIIKSGKTNPTNHSRQEPNHLNKETTSIPYILHSARKLMLLPNTMQTKMATPSLQGNSISFLL